ncbi:hypothetical protein JYT20_01335 [Rhodothermus sp. AH-315-K08]|nr:hypothetical protein [Rhodothermus sp. AH-315-K08]
MKSATLPVPLSTAGKALWTAAQFTAVVATALVLVGLVVLPDLTLNIAWFAIVPLLPASFLINTALWRGICPIATANTLGAPSGGRRLTPASLAPLATAGIILLLILIPARRLVLNQNGLILAGTLVLIVLTAAVLGRLFRNKAGFCNTVCPILPVEKLYGQSPLIWVRNPRCIPCTACTPTGCIDRHPAKAMAGQSDDGRTWMKSPMGLFAAAFPGLIFGYFQTQDSPPSEWASIYAAILLPAALSLVILGGLVFAANIRGRSAAPVLGAIAMATYYWFAGPATAAAFSLAPVVGLTIRWSLLALIAIWLTRVLRSALAAPPP